MNICKGLAGAVICMAVAGCTTPYQRLTAMSLTGGYEDKDLGKDVYRVTFSGNGYTSRETVQTFWLWRCTELTLEKGFDGFEVLSDMRLTRGEEHPPGTRTSIAQARVAVFVPIIIPQDNSRMPVIEGDIRLLKAPVLPVPPKVFDARRLQETLKPYVEPLLKSPGNVKPHLHEYLYPAGRLTS
jgi:hypothetical protein